MDISVKTEKTKHMKDPMVHALEADTSSSILVEASGAAAADADATATFASSAATTFELGLKRAPREWLEVDDIAVAREMGIKQSPFPWRYCIADPMSSSISFATLCSVDLRLSLDDPVPFPFPFTPLLGPDRALRRPPAYSTKDHDDGDDWWWYDMPLNLKRETDLGGETIEAWATSGPRTTQSAHA